VRTFPAITISPPDNRRGYSLEFYPMGGLDRPTAQ
jgi:hypothetical protein